MKKLFIGFIVIAFVFLFIYLVSPQKGFEGILASKVYLCPNGKEILYVYEKENTSAIYKYKMGDNQPKLLIKKNGWNLSQPSFSEDEKKIIYRAWQVNGHGVSIYIANADGSNPKEIYRGGILFSPKFSMYNNEDIFFIKASEFSNHSPISGKIANGMDLYIYNLKTKKLKNLTNEHYYEINHYDFIDKDKFVLNSFNDGIYNYEINDFKKEKLNFKTDLDSAYIDQLYTSPIGYSKNRKAYLLSTYFELFLLNENETALKKIYTTEPVGNRIQKTSFFKHENKIFISSDEHITIIDYNGNIINRFKIPAARSIPK